MVEPRPLLVGQADYLYFVERAARGMLAIVTELGDRRACERPELPSANTPYGLLAHCLGVMAYWGGRVVAGREVVRDRSSEFSATGTVAEITQQVEQALAHLRDDVAAVKPEDAPRNEPDKWALGPDRPLTQSTALVHLYEELAQHHGQMQVLRDALTDRAASPVAAPERTGSFDDVDLGWLRNKRSVKWHRPDPSLLPAWIADMDFPIAPVIRIAIQEAVDRGDLGYPDWPAHPLAEPFSKRMQARYQWSPNPDHVRGATDIIQVLQIVLSLATSPGDGIVAFVPNYPPFLATLATMSRPLVPAPVLPDGDSSWTWDHDRLAADLTRCRAKVLLLVNPHNPTGRVLTGAELRRLAELAERHDLIVISDEIHAELTHRPNKHIPFASLSPDAAARTVTVTSATKAFNIAGLRAAVAHVGPAELRKDWDAQPPDLFGATNVLGVEATIAAWTHGDSWLSALNTHLLRNRDRLAQRLEQLADLRMRRPEAGYLAWLDCAAARLPDEPARWFREHAGVELSVGSDFGQAHQDYARLNFATTTSLLDEMVDRLGRALQDR